MKNNPHLIGKIYFVIGMALIVLAVILAVSVVLNYNNWKSGVIQFQKSSSFQDLATTLSGTAGLVLTLSGIIYLIYTIQQSKAEMMETNKVMSRQLRESTFFSLLKNHKEIFLGDANDRASFEFEARTAQEQLKNYLILTRQSQYVSFPSFKENNSVPSDIYEKSLQFKTIGQNMLHVLNFIKEKLEDETFFHRTFYLSLSPGEKYLLGMILEHKLESMPEFDYDYRVYFNESSNFPSTTKIFPIVHFIGNLAGIDYHVDELSSTERILEVIRFETAFRVEVPSQTSLKAVWFTANAWDGSQYVARKNAALFCEEDGFYDLTQVYKMFAFNYLQKGHEIDIDLDFVFNFENTEFHVLERGIKLRAWPKFKGFAINHLRFSGS